MTKKEYLKQLQAVIDLLQEYLKSIPEDDYIERAVTLGKINGLLRAKIYAYDIEA